MKDKEIYMDDIMYLPLHYHNMQVKEPFFEGRGNLNVKELEDLCEQFKEYIHQQAVIKQNLKQIVISEKFNIPLTEVKEDY